MSSVAKNHLGIRANCWTIEADTADMTRPPAPVRSFPVAASPQNVILDACKCALLVVDMQNDFCHREGWLSHIGVDITPACSPVQPLQALLPALRRHGIPIIWVNWGNRQDLLNLSPATLHVYDPQGAGVGLGSPLPHNGSRVLEAGSWGAAIVDGLDPKPEDIRVAKYRMSGFWDTALDSILRNLGVTTCFFAGVNMDQCVMATLQDANFLGYDCLLVEDCSATTSPAYCRDATLYNVRQCFGFVTRSRAVLEGLAALDQSTREV